MIAIISLTIASLLILFLGFTKNRSVILPIGIISLIIATWSIHADTSLWNSYMQGMMDITGVAKTFALILLGVSMCIFPFFNELKNRGHEELSDFVGIILLAIIGGIIMVSYQHVMTLFLGIEILSIAMYVLAGANRRERKSNEASLKYFILGAFASALLMFGIALYYASTGTLSINNIIVINSNLYQISLMIIFCGFAFKIALAPFHFWAPDVYEGTPTLFTIVMATIVKIASFGALYQFVLSQNASMPSWMFWFFAMIVICSMLMGNLFAYGQTSVKRILAFSSVVQSGFILIAFMSMNKQSAWVIGLYLISYALASIISFAVVYFVEQESGSDHLDSFAGLSKSNPLLAIVMTVALVSLAGVPLTAGFMSKLLVLQHANQVGISSLAVIALILAAIGFYYYFKIINAMFSQSADKSWHVTNLYKSVLIILTISIIVIGIYPNLLKSCLSF